MRRLHSTSALLLSCVLASSGRPVPSANSESHACATPATIAPIGVLLYSSIRRRELVPLGAVRLRGVPGAQHVDGVTSPVPVRVVVGLCSGIEMRRIHARRIVAVMQDVHVVWDHRDVNFVGHAVRFSLTPVQPERAVSEMKSRCLPDPAARAKDGMNGAILVDLLPESFKIASRDSHQAKDMASQTVAL